VKNDDEASFQIEQIDCEKTINDLQLNVHTRVCKETAQFRLKKFRWFQYLGVLNEEKMNATDQVAINDERYEFG
jgi:hypothetical protein